MHRRSRGDCRISLTAIRHGCTVARGRQAIVPQRRTASALADALARLYPPELLADNAAIAERCQFDLGQLHYEYPAELVPFGLSAGEHLRALSLTKARAHVGLRGVPPTVTRIA